MYSDGSPVGFACKARGTPAERARQLFEAQFKPRGEDGLYKYFKECERASPTEGTVSFRWTCCGMDYATGLNGCDHHRIGCLCDFCGAGKPFSHSSRGPGAGGVPDPDCVFAHGIPRPREGECGHPRSVTPQGIQNFKMREEFYRTIPESALKSTNTFVESLINAASRN